MALSKRDLEELKPAIDDTLNKVLGFSDSAVVTAALNCVSKGMSKAKCVDMLKPLLENAAPRFVESLFDTVAKKQSEAKSRKRSFRDEESSGSKKKKKFSAPFKEEEDLDEAPKPSPGQLTTQQIKNMMSNAREQIKAKKEQLMVMGITPNKLSTNGQGGVPSVSETQALVNNAMRKVKAAAEIQARIQEGMLKTGLAGKTETAPAPTADAANPDKALAPGPLILDEYGRTIDSAGRAIQLPQFVPTLKANIRAKRREEFKATQQEKPQDLATDASRFFDPRILNANEQRSKRGFKFHEKGKFQQIAQRIRAKAQLEKLQNEISQAARKTGISSATKLALITPKKAVKEGVIPGVEWWDSVILPSESYQDCYKQEAGSSSGAKKMDKFAGITLLVEHPIQMKPPAEPSNPVELPIYLTKKERKKLRRQRRREAQREVSEKIRLGLEPPPEPKVRMANLMRVLGTEAVQDPTKVEAHVRAQMAKRQRTHEEANAARKLTDEQRREKKIKKKKVPTATLR